jgi:cell division septation protein DedD
MLRLIVVLLALANGAFYAWHAGWLPALGAAAPGGSSSGSRLAEQVHPERLVVLTASGAAAAPASAPAFASAPAVTSESASATGTLAASVASTPSGQTSSASVSASEAQTPASMGTSTTKAAAQCLEAGPFTPDENRQALLQMGKVMPKGSWSSQAVSVPGLWLVYMGPYPDAESLQRKLVELRRLKNLSFEEVRSPSNLALGVALGRFADERQANASLETMRLRGVRTARVVNARPAMELMVLRVPQASEADQGKLSAMPLPAGNEALACAG